MRDRLGGPVDLAHYGRRLLGGVGRKAQRLAEDAGCDRAGRNRVDADIGLAELHRHAFGEMDDGSLGRAIDYRGGEAGEAAGDAAIVDDAAGTLLLHPGGSVLHAEHDTAHERGHRRIEAIDLEAFDAAGLRRAARIVEQAIDLAELIDRQRNQRAHLVFLRDVGLAEDASRAELLGERLSFRNPAARDDDFRAFGNEYLRRAQPDAAGCARDHRDLAVQPTHFVSPFENTVLVCDTISAGRNRRKPWEPNDVGPKGHDKLAAIAALENAGFALCSALIWIRCSREVTNP